LPRIPAEHQASASAAGRWARKPAAWLLLGLPKVERIASHSADGGRQHRGCGVGVEVNIGIHL
jgi:hypothetical protein